MKTTFDKLTRDALIERIRSLNDNSRADWGKMNVRQMIKHCRLWEEMIIDPTPGKRAFIGRIFGKMALKSVLKDDSPIGRNSPTTPGLKIKDTPGNLEDEKERWIALLEKHDSFSNPKFVHPFFGKMTEEQIGYMAYKHADHHLRQFNA